jgi:hypothetical protein
LGGVEVAAIAVLIGLCFLVSTGLFAIEVFIKRRDFVGQGLGLSFTVLGLLFYAAVYCDRIPSLPDSTRNLLDALPAHSQAMEMRVSPRFELLLLLILYILRFAIYVVLFVVPAITMPEEQYSSAIEVESRANDYTAPLLAFTALALAIAGASRVAYDFSISQQILLFVVLMLLYFASSFLYDLRQRLISLAVSISIAARDLLIALQVIILWIVLGLGKLERWRRRTPGDEDLFMANLEQRLRDARQRNQQRNRQARQKLAELAEDAKERPL